MDPAPTDNRSTDVGGEISSGGEPAPDLGRGSAAGRSLIGQGEGIAVFPPGAGETFTIFADAGATYILEFDPALVNARICALPMAVGSCSRT
jgi:hypothetical protein